MSVMSGIPLHKFRRFLKVGSPTAGHTSRTYNLGFPRCLSPPTSVARSFPRRRGCRGRVGSSAVADRAMKRIGTTFNLLLAGLVADRTRMRALATAVIDAGDRERASLARELHDSTAQQLAALVLQLSAAARETADPTVAERLDTMREQAKATLEEVRLLSHTVHPRVLDDLGLAAALRKLGRELGEVSGIE